MGSPLGDAGAAVPRLGQAAKTLTHQRIIAQMLNAAQGTRGDASRRATPRPCDGEGYPLAEPFTGHKDALDNLPDNLVPVGHRRGGRMPQRGDIRRQLLARLSLRPAQGSRVRRQKPLIIFLELSLYGQLVFPCFGQGPSHEAMLGFDQAIVTRRPLTVIGWPLQAMLPQLVQLLAFRLEARRGLSRQGARGRFERFEHPLTHEGITGLTRAIVAIGSPIVARHHATGVARHVVRATLAHWHAALPLATDQQPGQEGRAMTHRPHGIRTVTVRREASAIAFGLGPGTIRGHRSVPPDRGILAPLRHSPRTRAARLLFPGVHLATTIGLRTRIPRGLEQIL